MVKAAPCTSENRTVDQVNTAIDHALADLAGFAWLDGRCQDHGSTAIKAGEQAILGEDHSLGLIAVHDHDENGIRPLGDFRRRAGRNSAEPDKCLEPCRVEVEAAHGEAVPDQIARKPAAHMAQTNNTDGFLDKTP
ncbi:MAG: hypothetical protein R3C97_04575 [Geminicoccaceae bacterium]